MTGPDASTRYRPFDGDDWLGRELELADGVYRVLPETAFTVAQEMAFARQGRKARVFKLVGPGGSPFALKTFYRGFSLPEYAAIMPALEAFGDIRGLRTCQRRLILPDEAAAVGEPGLAYAVLMPWIEGVPWAGVVEGRFPLSSATSLDLAVQTADILAEIEALGLAHADVSSSNVIITSSPAGSAVEFIDVEDMFHDSLGELPYVPDGSPGYAHPRNQGRGCRNRYGDRFAGGVLLAELLAWTEPAVREACGDVSVFDPGELCRGGPKFGLVRRALQDRSDELARLFERVWDSTGPAGCPRLAEWAAAIAALATGDSVPAPRRPDVAEGAALRCPGCGQSTMAGVSGVDHKPDCPLRGPSAPTLFADKSSFPGVPTHEDIGFVPLFDG